MDTKSIVVLGNGFDVALGIPTKYKDFYEKSQELRHFANNGNSLCLHIIKHVQSEQWCDLESGLYLYSLEITKKYGENNIIQTEKFIKEFNELRYALFNYLKKVVNNIVDVNKSSPVIGLNTEWHKLHPQYLTFNYSINTANTASMNNRYIFNNDDSINEQKFIYQHGSIFDTQACQYRKPEEIVVGIDSSIQQVEQAHSFLYKEKQCLHKLTSTIKYIKGKQIYIIYGCSIGDSDAVYFKEIFNEVQEDKIFLIYGFGPDNIKSIQANIERICNITIPNFVSRNKMFFLDVQQVDNTRKKTNAIITAYLKNLIDRT